ncbi:MAG: PEP-CTERM sorting domain-containing protein [Planctomycetaceae bacterium]|nr:MAG: PEP-CTERM sorting domain-containing protein [Planctomycetaceae bacterium]
MKNALLMTLVVALMAVSAQAGISYSAFCYTANDASDNAIVNGTYVMVMDRDNDGILPTGYDNSGSWLWDADDLLMDRGQIGEAANGVAGFAYPFYSTMTLPANYTVNTDKIYVLWFDVAYSATATGPGAGVAYGIEDCGFVGADNADYTVDMVGGSAPLSTIPEPVTVVVLLVGGALVAARKRRLCA